MTEQKNIVIRDKGHEYRDKVDVLIKVTPDLPYNAKTLSGYVRHLIDKAYKEVVK